MIPEPYLKAANPAPPSPLALLGLLLAVATAPLRSRRDEVAVSEEPSVPSPPAHLDKAAVLSPDPTILRVAPSVPHAAVAAAVAQAAAEAGLLENSLAVGLTFENGPYFDGDKSCGDGSCGFCEQVVAPVATSGWLHETSLTPEQQAALLEKLAADEDDDLYADENPSTAVYLEDFAAPLNYDFSTDPRWSVRYAELLDAELLDEGLSVGEVVEEVTGEAVHGPTVTETTEIEVKITRRRSTDDLDGNGTSEEDTYEYRENRTVVLG